jgi:hypothetical protein|tara:strand:- start:171 stop:425 length:255 start_codon:yes stop_codon:yes gene_type:complete
LSRSSQAKQILENSIFQESIDTLKKNYRDALFEQTGVNDNIAREKLWLAYQVLGKVENHFKEILETGKLAEKQLADFQKQDKKF